VHPDLQQAIRKTIQGRGAAGGERKCTLRACIWSAMSRLALWLPF
jgi:hypothetical protein